MQKIIKLNMINLKKAVIENLFRRCRDEKVQKYYFIIEDIIFNHKNQIFIIHIKFDIQFLIF